MSFLDTQVSLAPTHVSLLVSDNFETSGVKRNSITHDDLSCCSELPESKDGNASRVYESFIVYEGLNAQKCYEG